MKKTDVIITCMQISVTGGMARKGQKCTLANAEAKHLVDTKKARYATAADEKKFKEAEAEARKVAAGEQLERLGGEIEAAEQSLEKLNEQKKELEAIAGKKPVKKTAE